MPPPRSFPLMGSLSTISWQAPRDDMNARPLRWASLSGIRRLRCRVRARRRRRRGRRGAPIGLAMLELADLELGLLLADPARRRGDDRHGRDPRREMSTEHGAWRRTLRATLPSRRRARPVRPRDPITMRSASHSVVALTICSEGSPSRGSGLAMSPAAVSRAADSRASRSCAARASRRASWYAAPRRASTAQPRSPREPARARRSRRAPPARGRRSAPPAGSPPRALPPSRPPRRRAARA